MTLTDQILAASERVFDHHGFTASGMDRLTAAADVSSRTLYKHLGGKTALIVATLDRRRDRFFRALDVDSVDGLFFALSEWSRSEGARGCYFLRAIADAGSELPKIREAVEGYRAALRDLIERLVLKDTGSTQLTDSIQVLFEGAVATASYRGSQAVDAARNAADVLIRCHSQSLKD